MTAEEKLIYNCVVAVEQLHGGDTRLTNCILKLSQAKDHIGNFFDNLPEPLIKTLDELTFGQAIEALKLQHKVARKGWNGKGMYLQLQVVDEHSKMQHNYIYMSDVNGKFFPWNPNNLDILAEDWCII